LIGVIGISDIGKWKIQIELLIHQRP